MTLSHLPALARWLGFAGLLPFFGALALALLGPPELEGFAVAALGTYGAVILSFLGAVHWGLALANPAAPARGWRLGLGVVPALIAWVALLLEAGSSLALLAAALVGTALVETLAARRGLLPPGYLALRWMLSLAAGLCLAIAALAFWEY
jgi:Protein of unknown function (DUF3429)